MIVVSACLAGVACRYDGRALPHPLVLELVRRRQALPLCPEQLGGLPTPRPPCEAVPQASGRRVLTADGVDVTEALAAGAAQAFELVRMAGCWRAILKSRSPSCGAGLVYDGSFTGRLAPGDGLFAALLRHHGVALLTDEDLAGPGGPQLS